MIADNPKSGAKAIVAIVSVGLVLVAVVGSLWILRSGQQGMAQPAQAAAENATYLLISLPLALIGALLVIRRGENVVSWIILAAGLSLALTGFVNPYCEIGPTVEPLWPALLSVCWLSQWAFLLPYLTLVLLLFTFPTGKLLSRRWGWLLAACLIGYVGLVAMLALSATIEGGPDDALFYMPNPIGFLPPAEQAGTLSFGFFIATLLGSIAASVAALAMRFRRSVGEERQQMKWLLFAAALMLPMLIFQILNVPWSGALGNIIALGIPFAVAIAILRYRLYDIDLIIRRTTSYAILTALLAGVYFGSIVVLQRVLSPITGESKVAVVLSTLLIAAIFLPLHRRVQAVIDRRFYRRKYDTEKVLNQFAATVRDEPDLDQLTAELLRVIQETMQPESVSLWLLPIESSPRRKADS
jgi:hypothetical protein